MTGTRRPKDRDLSRFAARTKGVTTLKSHRKIITPLVLNSEQEGQTGMGAKMERQQEGRQTSQEDYIKKIYRLALQALQENPKAKPCHKNCSTKDRPLSPPAIPIPIPHRGLTTLRMR